MTPALTTLLDKGAAPREAAKAASIPAKPGRRPRAQRPPDSPEERRRRLLDDLKATRGIRRTYSAREVEVLTGASKSFIQRMVVEKTLASKLVGGRRFIMAESVNQHFPETVEA